MLRKNLKLYFFAVISSSHCCELHLQNPLLLSTRWLRSQQCTVHKLSSKEKWWSRYLNPGCCVTSLNVTIVLTFIWRCTATLLQEKVYFFPISFLFLSTKGIVAIVSLAFKFGWSWYNCFCLSLPLRSMFYANRFCLWYIAAERNLLFRCFFVECGVIKKIPMKQVSLSLPFFLSHAHAHTRSHSAVPACSHYLSPSHTHMVHRAHTVALMPTHIHTLFLSCTLTNAHYPNPAYTHTHGTHSLTLSPSQRNAQTFFSYFSCWNIFSKTELGLKSFKLDQMLPVLLLLLLLTPFSR